MQPIDLTHPLAPGMPVYPGTEPPEFVRACTIAANGFAETRLNLYSHTGTHMDAPAHILADGLPLDAMPVSRFIGPACVLDLTACAGQTVGVDTIRAQRARLAGCEFVLLRTGWGRFWGQPGYFGGYPILAVAAAAWLADLGLKGVGIDAISFDAVESRDLPVHRILLGRGLVLIENLANIEALPTTGFQLAAFPLKLRDADGSPVRAVGLV